MGVPAPGVSVPSPDAESVGVGASVGESVGETVAVGDADDVGEAVADGVADGVADAVGDASLVDGVGDAAGEPLDTVGLGVCEGVGVAHVGVGEYGKADGIVLGDDVALEAPADVVGGALVSSAVIVAHPAGEVLVGVGEPLVMAVPPCLGLVAPPGALPADDALFPVPTGLPLPSVPAPPG